MTNKTELGVVTAERQCWLLQLRLQRLYFFMLVNMLNLCSICVLVLGSKVITCLCKKHIFIDVHSTESIFFRLLIPVSAFVRGVNFQSV